MFLNSSVVILLLEHSVYTVFQKKFTPMTFMIDNNVK